MSAALLSVAPLATAGEIAQIAVRNLFVWQSLRQSPMAASDSEQPFTADKLNIH